MTTSPRTRTGSQAGRGAYFYLSYAHSAPPSDRAASETDHWVGVFYRQLTEAVRRVADPGAGLAIGLFDEHIQPGSDWNAAVGDALGSAEVFVALYSPGYFNKSWPLREKESFQQRLRDIEGVPDRQQHILPVLWIPLLSWTTPPEIRDALALGEGVPEYAENGLRALCMLPSYQRQYKIILDRIAARIVDVAERAPVRPSWAPPPDDVPAINQSRPRFVVAVVAPVDDHRPPGRDRHGYGAHAWQWRPFADEPAVPLAQYIADTAERLGLSARAVTYADLPQTITENAAVLLIDPWAAAEPAAAEQLRSTLDRLPEWVMPLVVVDPRDPQYLERGAELARTVAGMITPSGPPQIIEPRDARQFFMSVPVLVTEARRRYLKLVPAVPYKDNSGDDSSNPRKQTHG